WGRSAQLPSAAAGALWRAGAVELPYRRWRGERQRLHSVAGEGSMIRALVAEDEKPARQKLVRWLEELPDFQVVAQSADGIDALQSVSKAHPDVAFLDIQMPGLSGLEVAAQLEPQTAPL